jgi:SAM-dependent methyltransferase
MHENALLLFEKYAKSFFQDGQRVLEIGPDVIPTSHQQLFKDISLQWDTADLFDRPDVTYKFDDEYSCPIPDNSYDITLSSSVIEHVRKPWRWISELARITRPGGLVITVNPVSWDFHEAPVDCWRIYPDGMRALYEESSLFVVLSEFGSLETPHYRNYIPGLPRSCQSPGRRRIYTFLGPFGFPVERSYDTITIGRKAQYMLDNDDAVAQSKNEEQERQIDHLKSELASLREERAAFEMSVQTQLEELHQRVGTLVTGAETWLIPTLAKHAAALQRRRRRLGPIRFWRTGNRGSNGS